MKKMVNAAILVAVLTVAVLAPSMTYAAPQTVQVTRINTHTGISLLDMILSAFGFNPVSGSRTTPTQVPTSGAGAAISGPSVSTDGAIWGCTSGPRC